MYIIYYTETYQKNYRNSKQKFLINFRRDKVNIGSGNIMPEHSIFTYFVWASSNNDRLSFPDPMKFLHGECLFLRLGILLSEDRIVDSEQLGVAASTSMTSKSRWIFSVLWTDVQMLLVLGLIDLGIYSSSFCLTSVFWSKTLAVPFMRHVHKFHT